MAIALTFRSRKKIEKPPRRALALSQQAVNLSKLNVVVIECKKAQMANTK